MQSTADNNKLLFFNSAKLMLEFSDPALMILWLLIYGKSIENFSTPSQYHWSPCN